MGWVSVPVNVEPGPGRNKHPAVAVEVDHQVAVRVDMPGHGVEVALDADTRAARAEFDEDYRVLAGPPLGVPTLRHKRNVAATSRSYRPSRKWPRMPAIPGLLLSDGHACEVRGDGM